MGGFQSLERPKNPGRFPHVHQEVRVNTYWALVAYYSELPDMFQMTHLFGHISSPSDLKWELAIFDLKPSHPPLSPTQTLQDAARTTARLLGELFLEELVSPRILAQAEW